MNQLAEHYAMAALERHMNPLKQHYAYVKLGALLLLGEKPGA
jgi:hypothetical protein